MFFLLLSLIILPFTCTVYSMEQQSITSWDPNGNDFAKYASQFMPIPPTAPHREIHISANNNTQMADVELEYKTLDFIKSKYNVTTQKSSCLDQFLSNLPNENLTKAVKIFLTYQFAELHAKQGSCAIMQKLLKQYEAHFPVNTFSWNTNGDKVLHLAVRNNKLAFASNLVCDLHASLSITNNQQETPLMLFAVLDKTRKFEFTRLCKSKTSQGNVLRF